MAVERSPSFQFFPKDFLTDERVELMSHFERGIYITLLCRCWLEQSIPSDPTQIARLVNLPTARFRRFWDGPLSRCFHADGTGRLRQKRLDRERERQETFRQEQSTKGRAGAEARWQRPSTGHGSAISRPMPDDGSSSSSASSVSDLRSPDLSARARSLEPDEIAERGGRLVEKYGELFQLHRLGAKYRPRPNLDWVEACDLCRHWDDARLEKLAVLVLTTDEDFISKTDRSFRIFAMKASWADDRLRQWETAHQVTA